jgi:polyisoprenoid-binding protein YceI
MGATARPKWRRARCPNRTRFAGGRPDLLTQLRMAIPQKGQTCLIGSLDAPPLVSYGSPMAIHSGRHQFGTDQGRITLRTFRDGLAAQAGHDLTIEATRWSAELVVSPDETPASLRVTIDTGALTVRAGSGGIKPLTDRDKREIGVTARKVMSADRYPEATFVATTFKPEPGGGGAIGGTLTLAGQSAPLELRVSQAGPARYHATTTIRQTDFGLKPYTGFLGALKVRDTVDVEVDLDLPDADEQEPAA